MRLIGAALAFLLVFSTSATPLLRNSGSGPVSGFGPVTGGVPQNTVAPQISGTLLSGSTLTSTSGTWTGSPTYSYQWYSDPDPANLTLDNIIAGTPAAISGATTLSYTLTSNDVNDSMALLVTGSNGLGLSSAVSNVVGPVAPQSVPVYVSGASQSGDLVGPGGVVTINNGTWTNNPTSFSYTRFRCSASNCPAGFLNIGTTTSPTYTTIDGASGGCSGTVHADSDMHCYIQGRIVASNTGGNSTQLVISPAFGPIVAPTSPPTISTAPVITGAAQVGNPLTVSNGVWGNVPTTFTYQWLHGTASPPTTPISGATASTYTLASGACPTGDQNCYIQATVTASNAIAPATVASSNIVGPVIFPSVPTNSALPVVSGTLIGGQVLTATTGTWTNSPPTFAYSWYNGSSAVIAQGNAAAGGTTGLIAGATASTYTIQGTDTNTYLSARVTASNAAGPASAASVGVGPVAQPPPGISVNTVAPLINGQELVGSAVCGTAGAWSSSPSSYWWRWYVSPTPGTDASPGSSTGTAQCWTVATTGTVNPLNQYATLAVAAVNSAGVSPWTYYHSQNQIVASPAFTPQTVFGYPKLSGIPMATVALSIDPGTWTNCGTSAIPTCTYTFQWYRGTTPANATPIAGATTSAYTLVTGDVGSFVNCSVTATTSVSNPHPGLVATGTSVFSLQILPASISTNTFLPHIFGGNQVGQPIYVSSGVWDNYPQSYTYEWFRDSVSTPITGPTWSKTAYPWSGGSFSGAYMTAGSPSNAYVLTSADVGHTILARVTAVNPGGNSTPAMSQNYGNPPYPITAAPVIANAANCNGWHNASPPGGRDDGCAGAPVYRAGYTVQHPDFFTGYAQQSAQTYGNTGSGPGTGGCKSYNGQTPTTGCHPPWAVAGVDYPVGVSNVGSGFGAPGTQTDPTLGYQESGTGWINGVSGQTCTKTAPCTGSVNYGFNNPGRCGAAANKQIQCPVGSLTFSSGNATWAAGVATYTMNTPFLVQPGMDINFTAFNSLPVYNGTWHVLSVSGNQFTVAMPTDPITHTAVNGNAIPATVNTYGPVSGISISGSGPYTATVTLATPMTLLAGQTVGLDGFTPSAYNGNYPAASVTGSPVTSFTVSLPANPGAVTTQGFARSGIDIGPFDFSGQGNSTGTGYGLTISSAIQGPCVLHDDNFLFDLGYSASGTGVSAYNIAGCSSVVVRNVSMRLRDMTYNPPIMDGLWSVLPSPPFDNVGSGPSFGIAYFLAGNGSLNVPNGNIVRPIAISYSAFVNCPARCWSVGDLKASYNYLDGLNMYGMTPTTSGGHGDGWMTAFYDGPQGPSTIQVCNCDGMNESELFDTWLLPDYGGGGNTCFGCGPIIVPSATMTGSIAVGASQAKVTNVNMTYYNAGSQPQAFAGIGSSFNNSSGSWAYQLPAAPSAGSKIAQCYQGSATFPDTSTPGCSGPQAQSCTTATPCTYDLSVTWNSPLAPTNVSFGSYNPATIKTADFENNVYVGNITNSTGSVSDSGCPTAGQFPCAGVDHAAGGGAKTSSIVINNYADLCGIGPNAMKTGSTGGMTAGGQCLWAPGTYPYRGFGTTSFNPSGPNRSGGTPWAEGSIQEGGNVMMPTGACISFWSMQNSC